MAINPKDSTIWKKLSKCSEFWNWPIGSSKIRLKVAIVTNITGLRWYKVATGLSMPRVSCWSKSWVKLHRNPDITAAVRTNRKPVMSNFVSPSTVKTTPMTMTMIIEITKIRGFSKPNKSAKSSTQIGVLDFTMV